MGEYCVTGGKKVGGEIKIKGAKNSVLPILAGTILNKGESILINVPILQDTKNALEILKHIGCTYEIKKDVVTVNSKNINNFEIPSELVCKMRSSIIFLGALISTFGECKISYPGGCKLGERPIDLHLINLKKLGVEIIEDENYIYCKCKKIIGANLALNFPSVGATENLILASIKCKGKTTILNPAKEPEIVDLQNYLNSIGCNIKGAGSNCIVIEGIQNLHDTKHNIIPDRIVAGTYLIASAITDGSIILHDVNSTHLNSVLEVLSKIGCDVRTYTDDNKIFLSGKNKINSISLIETNPYPHFPTDMQSQIMSLLTISNGESRIIENLFEARNKNISELNKMGANIIKEKNNIYKIKGVKKLIGTLVNAMDLRGGASLILAALIAEGESIIKNSYHIERGYECIEKDLSLLNADIKFINN